MGNGLYNHHLDQQSFYTKNTVLPLLCRVSITDVKLREYKDRSASFSDDPSSPKVSCTGQVKKTNRFIGFSTPSKFTASSASCTSTTTTSVTSHVAITSKTKTNRGDFNYTKIKRFFSGKNLITSAAAATSTTTITNIKTAHGAGGWSRREIVIRRNGSRRSSKINNDHGCDHGCHNNNNHVTVDISELDPPLPVIKKVQQPSEVNLWKRRSGGLALKALQIEQIPVPKNNCPLASTV